MITSCAIVIDSTSELGEDQNHNVLLHTMLLQITVKVTYGRGNILPELGVRQQLVAVGIEAGVLSVVNPGSRPAQVT